MKKVLILNPRFLPGFRSGGPQQTVKNICDAFNEKAEIYLITKNCDFGSSEPYDLPTDVWLDLYGIKIKYLPESEYGFKKFKEAYQEFDYIYSCGLFCENSYHMMFIHRFFGKAGKKLYVAPMGVFSENAISSKGAKKQFFLKMCSALGLFKHIIWSFTSSMELEEAQKALRQRINDYIIAEDLPRKIDFNTQADKVSKKQNGKLRVIFLSRISPKKNLEKCFEILKHTFDGDIIFDIYGTKESEEYWNKCWALRDRLPNNVVTNYCGEVTPDQVIDTFGEYDIFLFPTKGENFGHVIYEALAGGCVPIISDTTPWCDFENKKCGYICSLDDTGAFQKALSEVIALSDEEFQQMKNNALYYAENKYNTSIKDSGYNKVFL